jgi:hypothetical protein
LRGKSKQDSGKDWPRVQSPDPDPTPDYRVLIIVNIVYSEQDVPANPISGNSKSAQTKVKEWESAIWSTHQLINLKKGVDLKGTEECACPQGHPSYAGVVHHTQLALPCKLAPVSTIRKLALYASSHSSTLVERRKKKWEPK